MTAIFGTNLIFEVEEGDISPDVVLECQGGRDGPCIYVGKEEGDDGC